MRAGLVVARGDWPLQGSCRPLAAPLLQHNEARPRQPHGSAPRGRLSPACTRDARAPVSRCVWRSSPFASRPCTRRHSPSPSITSPLQLGKPVWLLRGQAGRQVRGTASRTRLGASWGSGVAAAGVQPPAARSARGAQATGIPAGRAPELHAVDWVHVEAQQLQREHGALQAQREGGSRAGLRSAAAAAPPCPTPAAPPQLRRPAVRAPTRLVAAVSADHMRLNGQHARRERRRLLVATASGSGGGGGGVGHRGCRAPGRCADWLQEALTATSGSRQAAAEHRPGGRLDQGPAAGSSPFQLSRDTMLCAVRTHRRSGRTGGSSKLAEELAAAAGGQRAAGRMMMLPNPGRPAQRMPEGCHVAL